MADFITISLHNLESLVGNPPSGKSDKLVSVSRKRLEELLGRTWNEDDHSREPAGSSDGGQFGAGGGDAAGDQSVDSKFKPINNKDLISHELKEEAFGTKEDFIRALKAIHAFQGGNGNELADEIIRSLRSGESSDKVKGIVSDVDFGFEHSKPVARDSFVYRGLHEDFFKNLTVGQEFTDRSYVSTTTRQKWANWYGKKTMILEIPKGTKMISPPDSVYFELTLDRGTKFKVVAKSENKVRVTVVNE